MKCLLPSKESWPNEEYLIRLLDDESEVVKEALLKLFKENSDNAQLFLCKVSKHNSLAGKHARAIQEKLGWTFDGFKPMKVQRNRVGSQQRLSW